MNETSEKQESLHPDAWTVRLQDEVERYTLLRNRGFDVSLYNLKLAWGYANAACERLKHGNTVDAQANVEASVEHYRKFTAHVEATVANLSPPKEEAKQPIIVNVENPVHVHPTIEKVPYGMHVKRDEDGRITSIHPLPKGTPQ